MMVGHRVRCAVAIAAAFLALTGCFRKRKFDNPIAKDTQQPDKVLFDKAVEDLSKGRYSQGRLLLQTLMNTYENSEFLAKAKLATAESWYMEGGTSGLAQAEAEYKDFILFYPAMEEAAEAQQKICGIHYNQMEKADRDPTHALRAEDECRTLLAQFPNSKFTPQTEQMMREIQENLANGEYKVGRFYLTKGSNFPAANRLQTVADQYPMFSAADEALWLSAEAWDRLGSRFRLQQIANLTNLVRKYPLSARVDAAKERLQALEAPIPEADPVALERMKYELANRNEPGMWSKFWGAFSMHPNLSLAAKSGAPQMEGLRPSIPANVPPGAAGVQGTSGDVTVSAAGDPSALENNPDARANPPAEGGAEAAPAAEGGAAAPAATPQAAQPNNKKQATPPKQPKAPKKNGKTQAPAAQPAAVDAAAPTK
jgi:outer membrane protein assembly factor BamD